MGAGISSLTKHLNRTPHLKRLWLDNVKMLFIRQQDMIFHLHLVKNCPRIVVTLGDQCDSNGVATMALQPMPDCYFMFISFCYLFSLHLVFAPSINFKARLNRIFLVCH